MSSFSVRYGHGIMLQHSVYSEPIPPTGCLPQELIDHIIDHLHDDKISLEKCACVAPNWTGSAFYHLHHTRIVACVGETTFIDGLRILERKIVACKYVQVLHLVGRFVSPIQAPLDPSSLILALAQLPSLKVLRIRRARLRSQTVQPYNNSQQRSTSLNSGVSLRCLDLHNVHVLGDDPFLPIIQLLLLFDSIDSLGASLCSCRRPEWRSIQWQGLDTLARMDLPTHLRVQSLFVHPRKSPQACIGDVFVDTVRKAHTQTLKSFECLISDVSAKFGMLQGLIDDAGSSIENLTLRFIEGDIPGKSCLSD